MVVINPYRNSVKKTPLPFFKLLQFYKELKLTGFTLSKGGSGGQKRTVLPYHTTPYCRRSITDQSSPDLTIFHLSTTTPTVYFKKRHQHFVRCVPFTSLLVQPPSFLSFLSQTTSISLFSILESLFALLEY